MVLVHEPAETAYITKLAEWVNIYDIMADTKEMYEIDYWVHHINKEESEYIGKEVHS